MLLENFQFELPKKLIANSPVEPRDYARLLIYEKSTGQKTFGHFYDLPEFLDKNDVLILNNSRVIPARLRFSWAGKEVEVFFLECQEGIWKAMVNPGKKFRKGERIQYMGLMIEVVDVDNEGFRYLKLNLNQEQLKNYLLSFGQMPIPPYISGKNFRNEDYNTVYSKVDGSVAAPTAGLHFTDQLLSRLEAKGVIVEYVTLHVGLGTFLPVKAQDSRLHKMHSERYQIDYFTAERLNKYLSQGKRLIPVGTTAVRVLEDNFGRFGCFTPGLFSTDIFIKPGYDWKVVKALITNFHLPKSTLFMLVSALTEREKLLELYDEAIKRAMRFYSFGDGMLII